METVHPDLSSPSSALSPEHTPTTLGLEHILRADGLVSRASRGEAMVRREAEAAWRRESGRGGSRRWLSNSVVVFSPVGSPRSTSFSHVNL